MGYKNYLLHLFGSVWVWLDCFIEVGKRMLQLFRHNITASPCGSFNADPSAILEGNEISGQRRECHSYYWMNGFNWSGCRLDFRYLHKDTTKKKKKSLISISLSFKCLLKRKMQTWALRILSWNPHFPPLRNWTMGNFNSDRLCEQEELLLCTPLGRWALSFAHTKQQQLSLLTAVASKNQDGAESHTSSCTRSKSLLGLTQPAGLQQHTHRTVKASMNYWEPTLGMSPRRLQLLGECTHLHSCRFLSVLCI